MNNSLKVRLMIGLAMAAFAYFSYLSKTSINPVTGEKQKVSLTAAQEIAMGLQSAPQMAAEMGGETRDPDLLRFVQAVGQKLVAKTEAGNSPYKNNFQFHVLADKQTINAFALPGGQIFITEGLLARLDKDKFEDELAGVLGHEIGHVIGRHSAEHLAKQELTQGLIGAVTAATSDGSGMSGQQIAAMVGNMITMKHGREDELESDKWGVKYSMQCGYDPEGMIRVMEILKQAMGNSRQSEFASSHPSPENRIVKLREEIAKLRGGAAK
jgi:predicted Zn-dependent protease